MDTTRDGRLRRMLEYKGVGLIRFSHKTWYKVPPNTYLNGNTPIYAGQYPSNLKLANFYMLPFNTSPEDNSAWSIEVTARAMIGDHLLKMEWPTGRRLGTIQPWSVNHYN